MITVIKKRFHQWTGPGRKRFFNDDFNWETYTRDKYGPQQVVLDRDYDLQVDDRASFDSNANRLNTGSLRLHPNFHTVYETIGKLAPASVYEIGCGGGDHVRNLSRLYPQMEIHGGDRSINQIEFLKERNPEVAELVQQQDITMPFSSHWRTAELVYSQAVIMHIKTAVSHLVALSNMFRMAERYVVLMENYGCHPFVDDIKQLHEGGHLTWENVHFHEAHCDGRPYCLVVSREPCDLPLLQDYFALPHATKIRY